VIIQFADRIAKRQFFVEKLLTIIFQGQSASLQGQGVNTPKVQQLAPEQSAGWNTIYTFLFKVPYIFNGRKLLDFPGGNAPKLALPLVFCSRYHTWGSDGKLYSPWTDGRVKVRRLKGQKGAAGGSGGSLFSFSIDVTKIQHFIRLQSSMF